MAKAIDFTRQIHELTRDFPKEELYILTAQMKRAADSIALNIAEGSTGSTNKQFSNFLGTAIRSGIEVVSCLYIGRAREIISESLFQSNYEEVTVIIKMTQALRNGIEANKEHE
ncbi:MAG: four helix bundle protein [Saprospiraceae bacterium]